MPQWKIPASLACRRSLNLLTAHEIFLDHLRLTQHLSVTMTRINIFKSFAVVVALCFIPHHAVAFTARTDRSQRVCREQGNIGGIETRSAVVLSAVPPMEVIEPSYNLAIGSAALGAAFGVPGSPLKSKLSAFLGGIPLLAFGLFLAFQTTTLRFTLDDNDFSLVKADMSSTGENVVVGGENKWAFDKFVNYDFFPSRGFPVLVYFKETQTPEDMWNIGPGEQANSPEAIAKGAKPGQVHFFPAIGNVEQLAKGFESHNCAKI